MKTRILVVMSVLWLALSGCDRRSAPSLVGHYVVSYVNPVWAQKEGLALAEVNKTEIWLRPDGSATIRGEPFVKATKGSGIGESPGTWSQLPSQPKKIDLLIAARKLSVPVGIAESNDQVILEYSEDPELPTNIRLRKVND